MYQLCLKLILFFVLIADSKLALALNDGDPGEKIKVGLLLPLSGQYAPVGSDNQQGIAVALAELGEAANLMFITADSRTDPIHSISEFRRLVNSEKVSAVFAFRSPVGMAVNPLSKAMTIPLLGGVGHKQFALDNEFAFQIWPRSDLEGAFIAEQMQAHGAKRPAVFTVDDEWPASLSVGFRDRALTLGLTISVDEHLLPSETEIRTMLSRVKRSDADSIFLNVGLNQIAPFLKQLRELDLKLPVFSNFWGGKKEVLVAAGPAAEGLLVAEMATDQPWLRAETQRLFQTNPSGATLSAYVTVMMLGQALKDLSAANPAEVYKRMLAVSEIHTKAGDFIIKDRTVAFPMALRVVRGGEVVDLSK